MIDLCDGAEDGEVVDLNGLFLLLDHVAHALRQGAPDHVEETKSFPLGDLEGVCATRRSDRRVSVGLIRGSWVFDELEVELGEAFVEVAWLVNALFEESELANYGGTHDRYCSASSLN